MIRAKKKKSDGIEINLKEYNSIKIQGRFGKEIYIFRNEKTPEIKNSIDIKIRQFKRELVNWKSDLRKLPPLLHRKRKST